MTAGSLLDLASQVGEEGSLCRRVAKFLLSPSHPAMSNVAVWGPHLRASNEGLLRPRVVRVQKTLPGYLRDPLSTFYWEDARCRFYCARRARPF